MLSAIPIEDLTESGNQILKKLNVRLTALQEDYMYVVAAYVPEKLKELRNSRPSVHSTWFFYVFI